jgi:peptide deformylase
MEMGEIMSIRPLVQIEQKDFKVEDIDLRKPCQEVTDFGEDFQKSVEDLVETFWSHKIAVGLAANQIGIPLKVAVINPTRDNKVPDLLLVNPVITSLTGKKDVKKESCMSIPHFAGEVERRKKVSISYKDRHGNEQQLDAEGFLARVIQHETDHLDGKLYLDRMGDLSRLAATNIFGKD